MGGKALSLGKVQPFRGWEEEWVAENPQRKSYSVSTLRQEVRAAWGEVGEIGGKGIWPQRW